jgi:hypothetical protein
MIRINSTAIQYQSTHTERTTKYEYCTGNDNSRETSCTAGKILNDNIYQTNSSYTNY